MGMHTKARVGNWVPPTIILSLSYGLEIKSFIFLNQITMLARLTVQRALGICLLLLSMLFLQAHVDLPIYVDAENSNANPHAYIPSAVTH